MTNDEIMNKMAEAILGFEARRDKWGHLAVYKLPANDGGGTYEVAGINDRFHPKEAAELRGLLLSGQYATAERRACEIMISYTDMMKNISDNHGVEFYLRDCCFNRGPGGAARILQRALHVNDDGHIGPVTGQALHKFAADPLGLLTYLRQAREDYERHVVGYRANFWDGLVNRWDKALAIARELA